jgi:hypothetical protein
VLDWDELDPARVERVAQMLVRDVFGATSMDGSGGDEAQDLRLEIPEGLVIFEIKSSKRRLASSHKSQVRRSLVRAVELHSPVRWVLVTRSNHTPGELAWFQSLSIHAPGVDLQWLGRDWLDAQIAGREEMISYVEGPEYKLLRRARQLELERAAGATGAQFLARLDDLLELGDGISPYWRWDLTTVGGERARVLAAKRPDAAEADPIALTPTFSFPRDDPDAEAISRQLHDVLQCGGDITIPGKFVAGLRVVAASDATQRLLGEQRQEVSALRIMSSENNVGLPLLTQLVIVGDVPEGSRTLDVSFTKRVGGAQGMTLSGADPSGTLLAELVLVGPPEALAGRLSVTLGPVAGRPAHEVLPVLRFLASARPGQSVQVMYGPSLLGRFVAPVAWPEDLRPIGRLVAALAVIGSHTGQVLRVPADLDPEMVRTVLDVAGALRGERAPLSYSGLNATVRPGMLDGFIAKVPEEGGALYASHDVTLSVGDQEVLVTGLATWAPRVRLTGRAELAALAEAEPDQEHVAAFEPIDGEGVYLVRAVDEPGEPWQSLEELD